MRGDGDVRPEGGLARELLATNSEEGAEHDGAGAHPGEHDLDWAEAVQRDLDEEEARSHRRASEASRSALVGLIVPGGSSGVGWVDGAWDCLLGDRRKPLA